jgi:hypothetical protein
MTQKGDSVKFGQDRGRWTRGDTKIKLNSANLISNARQAHVLSSPIQLQSNVQAGPVLGAAPVADIFTMSDEETHEVPLQHQRAFGSGIRRNTVKFVPSTDPGSSIPISNPSRKSVSDIYLSLVLPAESNDNTRTPPPNLAIPSPSEGASSEQHVCGVCNLPLSASAGLSDPLEITAPQTSLRPHEASLVHQICLTHSHPPSHLDRNRKGLTYLSSYGWDPDARLGLGVSGQGIQFPIKTKPKDDKMGIGAVLPKEADRRKKEKKEKLDAGKVRKLHEKDKKKAEKLRDLFYRNDDVERYLGGG